MGNRAFEAEDFPASAEKQKIVTHDGKPIADADSQTLEDEIAGRLNEQAARNKEDRWALQAAEQSNSKE